MILQRIGGEALLTSDQVAVEAFLADVRNALKIGKFENREKPWRFRETLSWLGGWMPQDAYDAVSELSYSDYKEGPEADEQDTQSDMYWIFKKKLKGEVVYIKLKVRYQHEKELIIKSFHIDNL